MHCDAIFNNYELRIQIRLLFMKCLQYWHFDCNKYVFYADHAESIALTYGMLEIILYLELKLEIFENIDDNEYTHQYKQNKQ